MLARNSRTAHRGADCIHLGVVSGKHIKFCKPLSLRRASSHRISASRFCAAVYIAACTAVCSLAIASICDCNWICTVAEDCIAWSWPSAAAARSRAEASFSETPDTGWHVEQRVQVGRGGAGAPPELSWRHECRCGCGCGCRWCGYGCGCWWKSGFADSCVCCGAVVRRVGGTRRGKAGGGLAWTAAVGMRVRVRVRPRRRRRRRRRRCRRRHQSSPLRVSTWLFRSRGFRCLRDGADEPLPEVGAFRDARWCVVRLILASCLWGYVTNSIVGIGKGPHPLGSTRNNAPFSLSFFLPPLDCERAFRHVA